MKKEKIVHEGYCHICNKYGKLTFEHIPPKAALNNSRVIVYTGDSLVKLISENDRYPWDTSNIPGKIIQQGLGDFTLCEKCNNLTGTLYGEEYKKWFETILYYINKNEDEYKKSTTIEIDLDNSYPGKFIRQVLSIICSTYSGFTKKYPFVKDLILDTNYKYEGDFEFRIYMYLLKTPYNSYTGINALGTKTGIKVVNEINLYPFGFILSLNNEKENETDITDFLKCDPNKKYNVKLGMNIHEKNSFFPLDYRTK